MKIATLEIKCIDKRQKCIWFIWSALLISTGDPLKLWYPSRSDHICPETAAKGITTAASLSKSNPKEREITRYPNEVRPRVCNHTSSISCLSGGHYVVILYHSVMHAEWSSCILAKGMENELTSAATKNSLCR